MPPVERDAFVAYMRSRQVFANVLKACVDVLKGGKTPTCVYLHPKSWTQLRLELQEPPPFDLRLQLLFFEHEVVNPEGVLVTDFPLNITELEPCGMYDGSASSLLG